MTIAKPVVASSIYPSAKGAAHAVRFGDAVYTAAILAKDHRGAIAGEGDVVAQAELSFANLAAVLEAAGVSSGDVGRLNCYIDPAGASRIADVRRVRDRFFASGAQAGTEVPLTLGEPGALIAVEAIAHAGAARHAESTRGATDTGWAEAKRVGEILYVTGRYGRGDSFLAQAKSIYDGLDRVLRANGVSWKDVVRVHQFATRNNVVIDESRQARAPYLNNGEFLSTSVVCHPADLAGIESLWEFVVDIEAALGAKTYHSVPTAWSNPGGLHVVKSGATAYFQAQMSRDAAGRTLHPHDAVAHAEQVCFNLSEMMKATGIGTSDIVHARSFCKHRKDVAAVRAVVDRWMSGGVCGRSELVADFFDPLAIVEIEITAKV